MVQKEKSSLWRMKHLLTKLSGDQSWVPCEMMETDDDIRLFGDGRNGYREHVQEKERLHVEAYEEKLALKAIAAAESALDRSLEPGPAVEAADATSEPLPEEEDVAMIEASTAETPAVDSTTTPGDPPEDSELAKSDTEATEKNSTIVVETLVVGATGEINKLGHLAEGDGMIGVATAEEIEKVPGSAEFTPPDDTINGEEATTENQDDNPAPITRMRTRAQAQAATDETPASRNRSMTPGSNASYVHPYFMPPSSARPDQDLGLPTQEAEDTRRLLQLYIQKQEEVCRGAQKILDGLMRAERLRAIVLKWSKAEGHIGEMSDGEDWYDKEEWGLTEDLKKGQDEEEEDAATTAKKTRTRRQ
jgi:hypothetical protein